MIEEVLRDLPASRDSDVVLTLEIWQRFYPEKLRGGLSGMPQYVYLEDIFSLPREDNIKRLRAVVQNTRGLYPPTTLKVALERRMSENQWRAALGYPNDSYHLEIE